jgi:hypothetical protein
MFEKAQTDYEAMAQALAIEKALGSGRGKVGAHDQRCSITEDSNPEGHNRYTGGTKGDCTVIMPRGSVTEEAQDEFSEEMHPRDDRGRFGGGSNEQGRSHAAGEAGRGELAGQHFREGSKFPITVEGVHYSGQAGLKELDPGKYGSAHPGVEFKRIQQMEPGKLRDELMRRSYLYAGENPKPEGVLGGVHNAYAAKLTNIYDGAKDPEHLRETCKNGNEWERAVIDHHYDGYLAPSPGSHGSVVLLGTPAVKVSPVHAGAHGERLSVTEEVAA